MKNEIKNSMFSDKSFFTEPQLAKLVVTEIKIDTSSLLLSFSIGLNRFKHSIPFTNVYHLKSFNSNGLLLHVSLIETPYTIFITSTYLNSILPESSQQFNSHDGLVEGFWFIESVKYYKDFDIFFIRSNDFPRKTFFDDFPIDSEPRKNFTLFKGLYYTEPNAKGISKKYLNIKMFSNDHLIPVVYESVFINGLKNKIKIVIGKFIHSDIQGYVYINNLADLIEIQYQNGFKDHYSFSYKNQLLPVPCIPLLSPSMKLEKFTDVVYSSFISRTEILSIALLSDLSILSSEKKLNVYNDEIIDYYNSLPTDQKESIFFKSFESNDIPLKYLLFKYDVNGQSVGLFDELPDYNHFLNRIQEESQTTRSSENNDEVSWQYPDYWDTLDSSEKYADDSDLAEREFETDEDLDYRFDKMVEEVDYFANYFRNYDPVNKLISNIASVYIESNFAVFEIKIGHYFKRVECPILLNPFIEGLNAYSGILQYPRYGDIQFFIVEKCSPLFLTNIISNVFNFSSHRVIFSYNFFICFNSKFNNAYFNTHKLSEVSPTHLYKKELH